MWTCFCLIFFVLIGLVELCTWFTYGDCTHWSSCSQPCGGGTQSRKCYSCVWRIEKSEKRNCNEFCYNGGSYLSGRCHCSAWRSGSCCDNCRHISIPNCVLGQQECGGAPDGIKCTKCSDPYYSGGYNQGCKACTFIANCKRRYCTSASNTKCQECDNDKTFYKRTHSDTRCERMCAWNNHYCWPGRCSDELTKGCSCAPGFRKIQSSGETSCQPTRSPSILSCNTVAIGPNGEKKRARSSGNSTACQYLTDMYGNFQLSSFQFDMSAEYTVNITGYSKPGFIQESKFGITDTTINVIKISVNGARVRLSVHKQLVDTSASERAVQKTDNIGNISVTSSLYNLLDGQELCLEFDALAGGYLKSKNTITHVISAAVPYQKVRSTREICYRYDNTAPRHCKETGKCNHDPVQLQNRITRSSVTNVYFNGWLDPIPSGGSFAHSSSIESYQITVNEVPSSPEKLKVDYLSNVYTNKVDFDKTSMVLNLTSDKPRLYCITLEVKDVADNVRQARRFLLYDNTSFIETREDKPFLITSASVRTNFKWQTHHNDICVSWKDHFMNRFYFHNALLNPIEPAPHGLITDIYEQKSGVLPVSGTSNVYGIVKFMISWSLNEGHLTSEIAVPEFQNQSYCNDFNVQDGQTYTIVVRSIDIAGNTYMENRTAYIDRSVPHINNIWLRKDGYRTLFVHHEKDLSTMELYFEALDPHSGIRMVEWAFGIIDSGTELSTGALSVGVIGENSCPSNAVECYCPDVGLCEFFNYTVPLNKLVAINKHDGDHNRNYFFTIKVTNHAYLYNIEHIDILVDDSPPEVGVVYEGPEHTNDIDYTSDDTFLIHWHGFIDHESGIKTYRIGLAARCLGQTELYNFTSILDADFYADVPHTESSVRIPANFTGKRYISMVAFNNAMNPSEAICSDGITRVLLPPEIRNLTLEHGSWSETVVCHEGRAWLLHSSLSKTLLHNVSSCIDICNKSPQHHLLASALPTNNVQNKDSEISNFMCSRMRKYQNDTIIYLPTDHISIAWDVEEKGCQVDDIFIGIGTDPSEVNSPSIDSYQSTAKRTTFKRRHEGIGSDELFFIFLKVVNKASLDGVTILGPVLIDETPPIYKSVPNVDIHDENILVGWENDTFYDIEQKEQISSIYFEIGHDSTPVTPLLQWNLETALPCRHFSGGCFKYPVRLLQAQDNDLGLSFYINMHVYNKAGHALTVTTDTFRIPSRYPPGHATVFDIDPESGYNKGDTNVHFTSNTLCFRWTGFKHHEPVEVEVGVGSNNSTDNIVPYKHHNSTDSFKCIRSSKITFQQTYFALVRASCSGGVTVSVSNGVTILNRNVLMESLTVRLGEKCSTNSIIMPVFINSTAANLSITFSADVGKRYELFIPSSYIDSVYTNNCIIFTNTINNFSLSFVPFIKHPVIYINLNSGVIDKGNSIHIHKCPSTLYVGENDIISAHWFYSENKNHGLRFETALFHVKNMTRNSSQVQLTQYEASSNAMTHTFIDVNLKPKECYNVAVKQCSSAQCLEPVFSGMFCVVSSPEARSLNVSSLGKDVGASCSIIKLMWDAFRSDNRVLFYQWVVSQDNAANHILTEWETIIANDTEMYQVHSCIEIPVHLHSTMFGCVSAFDDAGNEGFACQDLKYIPTGEYIPDTVYDLNSNSKAWKSIQKVIPSSNIGHLYTVLHNNELDFGTPETQLVGVMLYATERNVTWYLMLKNQPPELCALNKDCITSKTTSTGYVNFNRKFISLNTFYYICAYSSVTVVEREMFSEHLDEIKSCSNGFVLDNEAPRPGIVKVRNTDGFLTTLYVLELFWEGFVDEIDASKLGYIDSIRTYSYAIGSRPHREDIRNFTNVGHRKRVVITGINLPDGSFIYFTVRATDYAGNSATSVSNEFIIDTSPPIRGQVQIASYDMYSGSILYITKDEIVVHLSGFKDDESGIDYFELGLGSKPYLMDVLPKSIYHDAIIDLNLYGISITDGHAYYIAAKAINRAGLSSELATLKVVVDKSRPTGGQVLEGDWTNKKDDDYQTDLSHVSVHWKGFSDSHSGIAYYRAGLGTKAYLDNLKPLVNVGLVQDITWNTEFIIGEKYYTTVEACNGAGLCVTRASDGIVIDNSPPIQGLVQIGSDEFHRKFQSHTSSVHVRWAGFDDPQSGIDHYEICIGTNPGDCDVLGNMNCLLQSNIIKTGLNLPHQTTLYATVTAYNKVWLRVKQTSDSFYVDATPPVMSIRPTFMLENINIPGKKGQWDKSVIKIFWKFYDDESPIADHDVTLVTHHEGHTPVEHLQLGSENELTINLDGKSWLHNGDTYYVTVTSCNLAGLCSSDKSEDLIIDSTPPHLGGFKPPMIWENVNSSLGEWKSNITLSWYGFHDQESGIERYFITISKTYSGHELTDGVVTVNVDGSEIENIHSFLLNESLERDDTLFLTIWAENAVGLNSSLARVTVTVLSSSSSLDSAELKGSLEVEKHSCDIQYCNNDCTCAVIGRPCVESERNIPCKEVNNSLSGQDIPDVEVFNGMNETSLNITISSACLSGSWRVKDAISNTNITRFEWCMGIQDQPVGEGVFDLKNERSWNDVGLQKQIVHCLAVNKTLIARETYTIYVRAWFSRSVYAIYRSAPIRVDHTAPSIARGRTVIDSNKLCHVDFDVIDWMDTITACWTDVFIEQQGHIMYYILSLGTYAFGDDTLRRQNVGFSTNITLTNISLSHGTKYFFTVTAYNNVGLYTAAISDGFVIDMDIPITGVIFNTRKHRNSAYQSSASTIGISWHGFQDAFSGIQNYFAAFSDMPYENGSIHFRNTGIQTNYMFQNLALEHGKTYYGLVKAIDKVGHISSVAVSKGITLDTSPPVGYKCEKYSYIGHIFKVTNGNDERAVHLEYNSSSKMLYNVTGYLSFVDDNYVKLKIRIQYGAIHMYLPLIEDHDQDHYFEHSFFAAASGLQDISIELENDDQAKIAVNMTLSECSQMSEDNNDAIQLKQIFRSQIAVHVLVTDEDSLLSKIELGAGTTADGFQVKPRSTVYHLKNSHLISTDAPHGTQVFVTAIAENQAGLRSVFHSRPITIDHTSPVVNNLVGGLRNVIVNVSEVLKVLTIVQATWDVIDEESGIRQCYCSIGHKPGLYDVNSPWIAQSTTSCESHKLQLSHGQEIYLNLKCVNNVELSAQLFTDPLVTSTEKPDTYTAVLAFVPHNEQSSEYISQVGSVFSIQSNHTCLELKWHSFDDPSGIDHYEYRLAQRGSAWFTDWTETDRNVVQIANVDMANGEITAEVRAINTGAFISEPINASLLVARYAPRLTGQATKIKRSGHMLNVNWAEVFKTVEGVPLSYSLTLGTRRGYADILDMNYITSMEYDVSIPDCTIITPNLKEVFVRIICIYATGLRTEYNTNYKM